MRKERRVLEATPEDRGPRGGVVREAVEKPQRAKPVVICGGMSVVIFIFSAAGVDAAEPVNRAAARAEASTGINNLFLSNVIM